MSTKASHTEKRSGLSDLEFDSRTRKRAEWEAFEYTVIAGNQIQVVNGSYGAEKDEHEYTVTVEQDDTGEITPLHCDCPAFQYQSGACKHQVAVAMHTVVLGAAVAYTNNSDTDPAAPVILADGGEVIPAETDAEGCDEDWCPGPRECDDDPVPFFDCFRTEE
jgi:hypothetical protein